MRSCSLSRGFRANASGRPPVGSGWWEALAVGLLAVLVAGGCRHAKVAAQDLWVIGAREVMERVVSEARHSDDDSHSVFQMAKAAEVMARMDRNAALELLTEAVRRTKSIPYLSRARFGGRISAYDTVGTSAARIDPKPALSLFETEISLAENAPPLEGLDRAAVMTEAASAIAAISPQAALAQVHRMPDAHSQAGVLIAAAAAFARTNPDVAESTLRRAVRMLVAAGELDAADAGRAHIAVALVRHFPKRAARLLPTVQGDYDRDWVLSRFVAVSATRDPKQALRYARMIKDRARAAAAFLELATAHPPDAARYLGAAAGSIKPALEEADWKAPAPVIEGVSLIAVAMAMTGQKNNALSLIGVAAARVRARCHDKLIRRKALILLSGAASQASPPSARRYLEEALDGVTSDMIGLDQEHLPLDQVAGPLGILDPGLAELCVQRLPHESKASALFEMAKYAAGTRPTKARRWLSQGQSLEKRGGSWARAVAEAELMPHPRYALRTVEFIYEPERTMVYLDIADVFLSRRPGRITTAPRASDWSTTTSRAAIWSLAVVLGW